MKTNKTVSLKYVFFGTGPLAERVLISLVQNGFIPSIVITKPDSPQDRHLNIKPPHIKIWCELKNIPVLQPDKLDDEFHHKLSGVEYDLFIVASYGKIIPLTILDIPKHGVLNVHPSLLPKYRGTSPIESALLNGDKETGVSIIKLDEEVDHGPILIQNCFIIDPIDTAGALEISCGQIGGELLSRILIDYVTDKIKLKDQNHDGASFCKKIDKSLGQIQLTDTVEMVRRKYRALTPWPGLYFFINHPFGKVSTELRIKINKIDLVTPCDDTLTAKNIILSVTPEGKNEINWENFERGYLSRK